MTAERVDVVVVGCGAAGLAATWACARRGLRVVGLDRFEPGHRRGSSHGTERIVRLGHTDPGYVSFALEAFDRWGALEVAARMPLLTRTGSLDVGDAGEVTEIARVCEAMGLPVEPLDVGQVRRRFPGLAVDGAALFQPDGGTVHADRALSVLRRLAVTAGAEMHAGVKVNRVVQLDEGVEVQVGDRRWRASAVVVTSGAWAPDVIDGIAELPGHRVTQEQLAFFRPHHAGSWPAFIHRDALRHYGMATPDGLVKVAEHHTGPVVDVEARSFELEPTTWERLRAWVAEHVPGVDPDPVDSATCLYASTADEDFVLDRVGDVVIGAGLSGHGFKFVPAIGERLADLADGTGWAANPFAFDRTPHRVGASGHK